MNTISEKYLSLYRELVGNLDKILLSIKTLSEGRIPIELITPEMLTNFTENVKEVLQNSHSGYILAFPHISYYYDMKLVTFGVDSSSSLVITFPIFIRPIHSVPLVLYEIEVIDVPVEDDDHTRDSYTKVQITKPYIAANENHYIELQITELRMCKVIQNCSWLNRQT